MKALFLVPALLLTPPLFAADLPPLPKPAEALVKNYQRDLAALRDKALKDLQAIMNAETQHGNANVAAAVKNAMEAINGGPLSAAGAVGAPPKTGKITVYANARPGADIGHFSAGQSIKLQYLEGKWFMRGFEPTKWVSPDDAGVDGSNRCAIYAVENGRTTRLAEVPAGTNKKPFRYRFERDYPQVVLRIVDDDPGDNPGFVIYNVDAMKGN